MLSIPQELLYAYKLNGPRTPSLNAYKGHHVDDCGKAHGKGTKKERLNGVPDHGNPNLRVQGVTEY